MKFIFDPLAAVRWFWRAMAGHSITFAALFGALLLGVSVLRLLRDWLGFLAMPWYAIWLVPVVIISLLAKWESQRIPDSRRRRWYARGILAASCLIAFGLAWIRPDPIEEEATVDPESVVDETVSSPRPASRPGPPSRR